MVVLADGGGRWIKRNQRVEWMAGRVGGGTQWFQNQSDG